MKEERVGMRDRGLEKILEKAKEQPKKSKTNIPKNKKVKNKKCTIQ